MNHHSKNFFDSIQLMIQKIDKSFEFLKNIWKSRFKTLNNKSQCELFKLGFDLFNQKKWIQINLEKKLKAIFLKILKNF